MGTVQILTHDRDNVISKARKRERERERKAK
jgi:hypothetical protein